jgi:hypothetical protein
MGLTIHSNLATLAATNNMGAEKKTLSEPVEELPPGMPIEESGGGLGETEGGVSDRLEARLSAMKELDQGAFSIADSGQAEEATKVAKAEILRDPATALQAQAASIGQQAVSLLG